MPDGANDKTQFTPAPAPGIAPGEAGRTGGASPQWRPPSPLDLQAQLPQYKVLDLLGHGGMGAVYKGWQVSLERYVAIKILPPDLDDDDVQFAARFKQEAKTMAKFLHPNIVAVFDAGETASGLLYIVMEFVEGTDVAQLVKSQGRLPPDHALAIVAHVCDALQYAHSRGVMHRDIKPANVMLNSEGQVKVADFGSAKATGSAQMGLTRTDMSMGTPDYIAPEALMLGVTPDHRADLYAVGVMLYNMLTGEIPRGKFKMPSQKAGTDPRFDAIVDRAMEQEREHRYQSAHEIRRDLDVILSTPMEKVAQSSAPTPVRNEQSTPQGGAKQAADRSVRAPSRAPVKKSGAGVLIAGLGAAAVIGIGAFVALKKPAAVPSGASSESAEAKAASVLAPTRTEYPAPKEWVDLMPLLRKEIGLGNAVEEAGGIRITSQVLASKHAGLKARNVATRVVVAPGGKAVNMSLRMGSKLECYRTMISSERVSFELMNLPGGKQWAGLGAIEKMPTGFDLQKENEYVFAAIGNKLRVWINHTFIGEAEDDQLTQGELSQSFAKDDRIQKWEYGILPDDASVVVSPSPSPQVPPASSSTEKWQDVLRPAVKLTITGPAERTPAGLRFTGSASVWHSGVLRDVGVRIRAVFDNSSPQARVRNSEAGIYACNLRDRKTVIFQRWDAVAKKAAILREFPLPTALPTGKDYELELRAIGQTFTVRLNGTVLGTVTDATFASGNTGVGLADYNGTETVVKSLEILDLDAPASAKASQTPAPQVSQSSPTHAAATKDAPFVNSLGMKFVPVPIGGGPTNGQRVLFSVWDTRVQDYAAHAAANPKMDGAWKMQAKDGVPVGREPNHPVVGVSWEDAQAFCQWLTAKETAEGKLPQGMKYRLPSDEEWSWAVGLPPEPGATPAEKNGKNSGNFPWGKDWPPSKKVGNYADESFHAKFPQNESASPDWNQNHWLEGYTDGFTTTSPVGSFPANAHGLYDMSGNVWQWCEDWWNANHRDRVVRGASWLYSDRAHLLCSFRANTEAEQNHRPDFGFRCVLAGSSPSSSGVSPSPATQVSKSSPQFPPGQWVKVFTKAEDAQQAQRDSDPGVKFASGWFTGWNRKVIALPVQGITNIGVRARFRRQRTGDGDGGGTAGISLRGPSIEGFRYQMIMEDQGASCRRFQSDPFHTIFSLPSASPLVPGAEYRLEFAAVGERLIARSGDSLVKVGKDALYKDGLAFVSGRDDIGDIEVINLDGLPEAEALRLLGVDEQGNDLRAK